MNCMNLTILISWLQLEPLFVMPKRGRAGSKHIQRLTLGTTKFRMIIFRNHPFQWHMVWTHGGLPPKGVVVISNIYIYVSFGHGSFLNAERNYNRSMVSMLKHKGQNNNSKQSSVGHQKASRMICGLYALFFAAITCSLAVSIAQFHHVSKLLFQPHGWLRQHETISLYTSFQVHVG